MPRHLIVAFTLAAFAPEMHAQHTSLPLKHAPQATTASITPADLMTRLYIFADDSMMGRQAGTVYHDRATNYIASELARMGLTPAGDGGTYFQQIPLLERRLAEATTLMVRGQPYVAWRDFLPRDNGPMARAMRNAPVVYGGVYGDRDRMLEPQQAAGKVVVFTVPEGWQSNRGALTALYSDAAAIVVSSMDSMPADVQHALAEPSVYFRNGDTGDPRVPAFFYTRVAMTDALLGAPAASVRVGAHGSSVTGTFNWVESAAHGGRNVVAILPGSDPALRGEYVAVGAHSDHIGSDAHTDFSLPVDHDSLYAFYHVARPSGADDGVKPATAEDWVKIRAMLDSLRRVRVARLDSIDNGADDDGSGSMALLEMAEALVSAPVKPRRSILFVWHVGEEEGLWGSQYFTDHPTVPRDSIVGQVNIDMIGRGDAADLPLGGPGYIESIGSRRLSTELGDLVEMQARAITPPFRLSYEFDANGHPEQYYCRSDHYNYARYGIPVVFLSTGNHPEYHQVTDEPQYIDYDKYARVTQLVYNVVGAVANLDHRLVVDKPKPDPKAPCVQ